MADRRFNTMDEYDAWRQQAETYIGQNWNSWNDEQRKAAMNRYREITAMAERDIGQAEKERQEDKAKDSQNTGAAIGVGTAIAAPIAHQVGQNIANPSDPNTNTTVNPDTTATTPEPTPPPTTSDSGGMVDPSTVGNAPGYGGEPVVIAQGTPVPEGYTAVGTDASGGVVTVPNENIQTDGSVNLGAYAQGAGGALQLYNAYKQYKEGDNIGAGISAVQGGTNIAAAAGSSVASAYAPYLSVAAGIYGGHKTAQSGNMTREQKGTRMAQQAALTWMDIYTLGLASLGEGWLRGTGTGGKYMRKLDRHSAKYSPVAKIIGAGLGGLDTKYTQIKNTQDLIKDAEKIKDENPEYLNYIMGARYNTVNEDLRKAQKESGVYYAGKYKTFDEYKAAGLEASDLTHVLGNIQTFGPEWASLTEEQRQIVTQAMINEDLYISDKGEVNILKKNRDKAKEIYNKLKESNFDPTLVGDPMFGKPPDGEQPPPTTQSASGTTSGEDAPFFGTPPTEEPKQGAEEFPQFEPENINNTQSAGAKSMAYDNNKMLTQGYGGVAANSLPQDPREQLYNDPGYQQRYSQITPQKIQELYNSPEYIARYGDEGERNKAYWEAHDKAVKWQRSEEGKKSMEFMNRLNSTAPAFAESFNKGELGQPQAYPGAVNPVATSMNPDMTAWGDPFHTLAMQGMGTQGAGASPTAPAQPSFLTPEQWAQVQQYQATNARKY